MPAWVGIELMAQAVSVFSGLELRAQGLPPRIGLLLGARTYEAHVPFFAVGARLRVRAALALRDATGLGVFDCTISERTSCSPAVRSRDICRRTSTSSWSRARMAEWVLVTGSSRGIGAAIARRLARDGYNLVLHCRSERQAARRQSPKQRAAAGVETRVLQFDVADRSAAQAALSADVENHGAYYGVVCNAGIARDGAFPALSHEDWDSVLRTNLDGFYNVLQPLVMPMIRRRKPGRIVTLSSVSGVIGNRGQVNYSAAKAGIIGATKALAVELASRAITVNCVAPGLIRTAMSAEAPIEEVLKLIPAQRIGEPEEVAAVVAFLMSDAASYVTRQVIGVNGGMC